MRFSSVVSSALILGTSFAVASDQQPLTTPSDVLDLSAETFETSVNPENLVLVEFFAPWCGHCKALAPEYEKAASELASKNIKLAKVDCVEHSDLCGQHGVTGYPTLKVFRNGTPADYSGPRKADGIVAYMTKQSLPAVSDVTAANHDEFKQADKVVVVAYLASKTDAPAAAFSSVAEQHRDQYMFGVSTDEAAAKAAGVTPPAIVLYKKFDEGRVDFPTAGIKDTSHSVLETFVSAESMPLLDEVSGENYPLYAESGLPLAYLFVDPAASDKDATLDAIKPVAKDYKGVINFVWIDAVKFVEHAKSLNVPTESWPRFVITDIKEGFKYPLDGAAPSADALAKHVQAFKAGSLEPSLKSEAIPASNDASVTVVVGKEYEKHILDESKDVLIEFYAPWCGHCKRLAPVYEELGEYFGDIKGVTIAKMDATENDIPPTAPFRVTGFPTIKFRAAGTSEFINYEGDRTLDSLIAFVNEHAKSDLSAAPKRPSAEKKAAEDEDKAPTHDTHDEL